MSDQAVRRRFVFIRYAVLLAVFVGALAASYAVIGLQAWDLSGCPPASSSSASLRWAVVIPTILVTAFCVGSAVYLYRRLNTVVHLAIWLTLALAVLSLGTWLATVITPFDWCF